MMRNGGDKMAYLGDASVIIEFKRGIIWRLLTSKFASWFYCIFKIKAKVYKSWLRNFFKVNIANRGWVRIKMPGWDNYCK